MFPSSNSVKMVQSSPSFYFINYSFINQPSEELHLEIYYFASLVEAYWKVPASNSVKWCNVVHHSTLLIILL